MGIKNTKRLALGLLKTPIDISSVKFVYFNGTKFNEKIEYDLNDEQNFIYNEKFNPNNKTVLYIFGYLENMNVESVQVIVEAYLKRNDINIIVLDWGELADGNYAFDAMPNASQLGYKIAKVLIKMFDKCLDINKLHIVGHSLGGQMSGIIGRIIKQETDGKRILKRITALDPAFPLFYFCLTTHLSKLDAEFVDVIHTDAWLYGAPISTGTADFWPNSGKTLQPGCPQRNYKFLSDNDLSSHRRSWWFWAESVTKQYNNKFVAVKAKSWSNFKSNQILPESENITVYMGDECPANVSGDYYLQTNGEIPFARGEKGISYSTSIS